MPNDAPRPRSLGPGQIDDSLSFIVTSFELKHTEIQKLPQWLQKRTPKPRTSWMQRLKNQRSYSRIREIPGRPVRFLGKKRNPANRCAASRLATDMLARGYVPLKIRIYIKRKSFGVPLYRLNVFWRKRGTDDRTSLNLLIDRNRALFDQLQTLTWNITCNEFLTLQNRSIVVDFRRSRTVAPSMRRGELGIQGNQFRFFAPVSYNTDAQTPVAAE